MTLFLRSEFLLKPQEQCQWQAGRQLSNLQPSGLFVSGQGHQRLDVLATHEEA